MPYIGKTTDGFGVRNRFVYLASSGATSVSGADANGATLTFTDGAYVDVYLNGVLLKPTTDYNTSTANTIAGLSALNTNDEVTVVVYDVFTVADMVSATSGGTFSGAVTLSGGVTGDLDLNTDSAAIKFGADDDVTVTHDPDDGLILKSTATGDDNPFLLTLQTGETDLAANDVIGKIAFQAPDEGTGTDAILVSGAIQARAEGDHSASSNATSLDFMTGASEAATTKMTLSSGGHLNLASGSITIDTVGQTLGVGTNNPLNTIHIKDTSPDIKIEETSSGGSKMLVLGVTSGGQPFIDAPQSGGQLNIDLIGTTKWNINQYGTITQSGNNSGSLVYEMNNANGTNPYGQRINFTGVDVDNNTTYFLAGEASSNNKFKIFSDGDMANHDNSYGSLSDERIKQDITDANSQWDDIKAVKVRNFKKKDDVEKYGNKAWLQIGVIAQELETVSPKLIKETPPEPSDIKHNSEFGTLYEDGDTIPEGKKVGDVKEIKSNVKKVSYSILYMKAVKALQEAMTRIETLEAKVKTLEEA